MNLTPTSSNQESAGNSPSLLSSTLSFGESLLCKGAALGEDLLALGASLTQASLDLMGEGVEMLFSLSTRVGSATAEVIGGAFEKILQGLVSLPNQAGNITHDTLELIAGDPSKTQGLTVRGIRLGIGLLPIVGNIQGVAQARMKYKLSLALLSGADKEQKEHEARRDCLIACTAFALEVCTLGVSGKIGTGLKASEITLNALNLGKVAREEAKKISWLPTINLDFLSTHVDQALEFTPIRDAMDLILRIELKNQCAAQTDISDNQEPAV